MAFNRSAAIIEDIIRLRHAMKPYFSAQLDRLNETGRPFNRPLTWDFPGDLRTWELAENGIGDQTTDCATLDSPSEHGELGVQNGDFVVLVVCNASELMQQWTLDPHSDHLTLQNNVKYCVDMGGTRNAKPPSGPYPLHMWTCNVGKYPAAHAAQTWSFDPQQILADPQKNGSCITLGDGIHPNLATGKGNSSCATWSFSGPAHSNSGALQSGGKCLAVVPYSQRPPPPPPVKNTGVIDQYMMGDDFMAAPILNLGQRARCVYFPQGSNWTHHYTSKVYEGGTTATVPAPLENFPLFKRTAVVLALAAHAAKARAPPLKTDDTPARTPATVTPYFGQNLTVVEGEDFSTPAGEAGATSCRGGWDGDGWSPCAWAVDGNLFASDVSNVFHSRRGYLHADANATLGGRAAAVVPIAADGLYHVLARYEAGYRFHSPFKVTVEQPAGTVLLSAVYGLRTTPKVWYYNTRRVHDWSQCRPGLVGECRWSFGATENMVWEGVNNTVALKRGSVKVTLTIVDIGGGEASEAPCSGRACSAAGDRWGVRTDGGDITERNVDALLFHPNSSDIATRLDGLAFPSAGNGLLLDSLIASQAGEVFARLDSSADAPFNFTFPRTWDRSPLWEEKIYYPTWVAASGGPRITDGCSGSLTCSGGATCAECITVLVPPHVATGWVDIGRMVDTLDHSTLALPHGNYTLTLALHEADGTMLELGTYSPGPGSPTECSNQVLMDASIRRTRRTRPMAADFFELAQNLSAMGPVHGHPPTHVPIFANTFNRQHPSSMQCGGRARPDPAYAAAVQRFDKMFGISRMELAVNESTTDFVWTTLTPTPESLAAFTILAADASEKYIVTKLGDEISLPTPHATSATENGKPTSADQKQRQLNAAFESWLRRSNNTPEQAGCEPYVGCVYTTNIGQAVGDPRQYYYSSRWSNDFGIQNSSYRNASETVKAFQKSSKKLQNFLTAANFPPSVGWGENLYNMSWGKSFVPEVALWVRSLREGTFALPWSEDYAFWIPTGSQQMYDLCVDTERAGVRPARSVVHRLAASPRDAARAELRALPASATVPGRPIMQYVMAHDPGNTPRSHRRRFYASLAHGVKWINLYQFQLSSSGAGEALSSPLSPACATVLSTKYKVQRLR